MAGTALAVDQPPRHPRQQRAWLVGHLVTDMEALGTFGGNTLAKVPGIVNALTDDQVALLAQYYLPHAEQDRTGRRPLRHAAAGLRRRGGRRRQGAGRRPADGDERRDRGVLRPVRHDAAAGPVPRPDLLRQRAGLVLRRRVLRPRVVLRQRLLRRALLRCRLRGRSGRCRSATPTTTTAAVSTRPTTTSPGPSTSTAASVWRSAMPTGYGIAATGGASWRTTASCIRLMADSRATPTRFPAGTQYHVANRNFAVRNPHATAVRTGSNRAFAGNRKPVVHIQAAKPHANRAPAVRPANHRQAAKPRTSHARLRMSMRPDPQSVPRTRDRRHTSGLTRVRAGIPGIADAEEASHACQHRVIAAPVGND